METIYWKQLTEIKQQQVLARSPLIENGNINQSVIEIIEQVKLSGDQALFTLAKKYDNVELQSLKVSEDDIAQAKIQVPEELKQAIHNAKQNIERFHLTQQPDSITIETQQGVICEMHTEAISRVGLYIPGGTAPLISTVMMLAIPAAIAGCKEKILITPPPVDPAILYAADLCGIKQIYLSGGAQGIAALAYGTETIPKVDKIFGPGNAYVTLAKRLVSEDNQAKVTIDMPAGPSELAIIADADANPRFVAADLLSQAEHGVDSQVLLITESQNLANQVTAEIANQLATLPRKDIAKQALDASRIILVENISQACEVSNTYAPEHLIVQTSEPRKLLPQIRAAGSIFLGAYTPESAGDYASGTNHVLPTYGYATSVSSLGLADFYRRYTVQELSFQGLHKLGPSLMTLAQAEQLDAHSHAVAIRLENSDEY